MADPLSISSGVIALVTFALQSSVALYTTIRSFQSQDKNARALKSELGDLASVLEALLETISNNPNIDFRALKLPILRCGKACEEYGDLIARCTRHSTESRSSFRDWITQKYLQGDINDFKAMLAGYKSTINIALANANIRVAAITPQVLEDYKDMIRDATIDLQAHLQKLDEKVQSLASRDDTGSDHGDIEWQAMLEEKESTQQGLRICAQLSAQIEELEPTSQENPQFSQRPSAHKYIKTGLDATKGSIQSIVSRLKSYEADIDRQMESMRSIVLLSEPDATQFTRLQETKESIRQCIQVVADASETSIVVERRNVFEDITMADDSYDFSISTVGDLVTARRINLTGRSRHVAGQISNESYQKTINAFAKLDMGSKMELTQVLDQTTSTPEPENESSARSEFGRYGPGFKLSSPAEGANPLRDVL